MTEELTIVPLSAISTDEKLRQAAWLLCMTCRIDGSKNHLTAIIGNGDEHNNHMAIKTWLESRLTELDDERLFLLEVEQLTDKLLDKLTLFQNTAH